MAVDDTIGNIRDFYKGRTVFVTGGTGFVGKVLLEKLLRSCDVKNIYLLIRDKKGVNSISRLKQLFDNKLFDRLKKEKPDFFDKVVCISGDFNEENIGIKTADYQMLRNNVSVIFHIGATVRFDLTLKETLMHNLYPMKVLIDLAKKMTHLKAFVYVSTAFSNTHEKNIYEKVYTSEIPVRCVLECMSWMDNNMFETLKPRFLSRHPNNYTYSKCLSEELLKEEEKNIPVVIVRPPLILSTLKEPFEGWIEQYNLMIAFIVSYGKGLIRTIPNYYLNTSEYIPVDCCVNMTISAAWDKAKKGNGSIIVYNCTVPAVNNSYRDLATIIKLQEKYPFMNCYRYPALFQAETKTLYFFYDIYFHYIPAILMDIILVILGRKAKMQFIYKKLWIRNQNSEFFLCNDWKFHAHNFIGLLESMSKEERDIFYFDVRETNFLNYLDTLVRSIRSNLLKENPSSIPQARNRIQKLLYLEVSAHILLFGGMIIVPLFLWDNVVSATNWTFSAIDFITNLSWNLFHSLFY